MVEPPARCAPVRSAAHAEITHGRIVFCARGLTFQPSIEPREAQGGVAFRDRSVERRALSEIHVSGEGHAALTVRPWTQYEAVKTALAARNPEAAVRPVL